jgi:hypothetical protein
MALYSVSGKGAEKDRKLGVGPVASLMERSRSISSLRVREEDGTSAHSRQASTTGESIERYSLERRMEATETSMIVFWHLLGIEADRRNSVSLMQDVKLPQRVFAESG